MSCLDPEKYTRLNFSLTDLEFSFFLTDLIFLLHFIFLCCNRNIKKMNAFCNQEEQTNCIKENESEYNGIG